MALLRSINNAEELDSLLHNNVNKSILIHFWAAWAPQCQQINTVLEELLKNLPVNEVVCLKVEAESVPELSAKYDIAAVPTCILLKNGKEVERINGVQITQLKNILVKSNVKNTTLTQDITARLEKLTRSAPVVLFMKGSPDAPKCGFSRTMVDLLNKENVKFSHFDILTDEAVRQGLKEYSNWPTYPQLYTDGELVGGLDVVKQLAESGELPSSLAADCVGADTDSQLKALINRNKVMLFMKGSPDMPRCGFSKSIVELLKTTGISFGHFDILTDNNVREQLKVYSNWPTYPQLYVNGELVGGLDIVKQMAEDGELQSMLAT